jgi:hypothetical protein
LHGGKVEPQVAEPDVHPPAATSQRHHLIEDRSAASDVGRHGGPGHSHRRKRTKPEDEARPEYDIQRVAEDEHAHGDRGVAGAAEHRVQQEQQEHRRVAPEHDPREPRARSNQVLRAAHDPQQSRCERRRDQRDPGRHAHAEHDRLPRGQRCSFAVVLAGAARDQCGGADRQAHRRGIDQCHHRLGQPDRGDRIGAETGDPEDVGHGEDGLHRHLDDHRYGEQDHRAPDRGRRVVDRGPPQGLAQCAPHVRQNYVPYLA